MAGAIDDEDDFFLTEGLNIDLSKIPTIKKATRKQTPKKPSTTKKEGEN